MIYISNKAKGKIENLNINNLYVVADFDRTITAGDSESTWGLLPNSNLVPKEYTSDREVLYKRYRPIEISLELDDATKSKEMSDWWRKHIELLIKYKISEEKVRIIANDESIMKLRNGAKAFLMALHNRSVPVIIISAGIGNFIEMFLKNKDCYYDNIYILSNNIIFENDIAVGINNRYIHPFNKNTVSLPSEASYLIKDRGNVLLFGDTIGDIKMVPEDKLEDTISIGFLDKDEEAHLEEFREHFDIVCTENTSFEEIQNILNIM
jgi:5'-nucleotidase